MKRIILIIFMLAFALEIVATLRVDIQDVWNGYVIKDSTRNVYVNVEEHYNGNWMCYLDSLTVAADSVKIRAYSCAYDSANTGVLIDTCQNVASWNLNGKMYLAKWIRFEIVGTDQSADSLYFRFRLLKERE